MLTATITALVVGFVPPQGPAPRTWYEQAEAALGCTALATEAERRSLGPFGVANPRDRAGFTAWFQGAPRNERHARLRHLAAVAAVGWWADRVNDQTVRTDGYLLIGALADRYAAAGDDPVFRQIGRCARAQLIGAGLEQQRLDLVDLAAANLVEQYAGPLAAESVSDWPLLLALRDARRDPRARTAIARLTTRAVELAGEALRRSDGARGSRWLEAAAQGLFAIGDTARARDLALRSMAAAGTPPPADARWRAFPLLYDLQSGLTGPADAARLAGLVDPPVPPGSIVDPRVTFDAMLRLAMAAETRGDYPAMGQRELAAFRALTNLGGLEQPSLLFHRQALDQLLARVDADLATVAERDPAAGARYVETYLRQAETLVTRAQSEFVADVHARLLARHQADKVLYALAELGRVRPADRARIADASFRLAQVRSFGGLTLAAVSAEARRANVTGDARSGLDRFFSLATQNGAWLRGLLGTLRTVEAPPPGPVVWRVMFALDVFQNETTGEFDGYLATVRRTVPGVAALIAPAAPGIREFQRRLAADEALVATQVTSREVYVWAVTRTAVSLVRRPVREGVLRDLIGRLRASLTPGAGAGTPALPAFDAAAAHEIYRLTFGQVAPQLAGISTVVWYGDGPLGAVPPGVLVTRPPPATTATTPAEFKALSFLVDAHAFAVLPDLSLFPVLRDKPAPVRQMASFLGVGAPLLAADEIDGARRARAYDLAGGLDGQALADLPKLEESVDEMKALAALFGEPRSTLWLGPAADEKALAATDLRRFKTIAFATHGFLADEVANVREPSLMLALQPGATDRFDGILTTTEVAGLDLDADLVILSACNTAGADGRPRADTFTGLTQAFFTAGARSLMASHWPVMSGAAVQLSVGTVERVVRGTVPLARSLQEAVQAVRRDAANPIESHPSYWGPFVIVGDGR